jgi:hypothetical protein
MSVRSAYCFLNSWRMVPSVCCVTEKSRKLPVYLPVDFLLIFTGITRMPWGHFISKKKLNPSVY